MTTRNDIVQAINTLHDAGAINYRCINNNTVTDVKDEDTRLWKRSITIGGFSFFTRLGTIYNAMKNRCLVGGSVQKNSPHYIGATMCKEWEDFDAFAEWASKEIGFYATDEHGRYFEIDKDLLGGDMKHYSPETSTMLPAIINVCLANNGSRGCYQTPNGKWYATICKHGKSEYLGVFDSQKKAVQAYRKARKQYIRELAKRFRHQLSVIAYEALMRYKQA